MAYYKQDGSAHGYYRFDGKYVPAAPIDLANIVCDDCAQEVVPFEPCQTAHVLHGAPMFWHQCRPWKWAPRFGENTACAVCHKENI